MTQMRIPNLYILYIYIPINKFTVGQIFHDVFRWRFHGFFTQLVEVFSWWPSWNILTTAPSDIMWPHRSRCPRARGHRMNLKFWWMKHTSPLGDVETERDGWVAICHLRFICICEYIYIYIDRYHVCTKVYMSIYIYIPLGGSKKAHNCAHKTSKIWVNPEAFQKTWVFALQPLGPNTKGRNP